MAIDVNFEDLSVSERFIEQLGLVAEDDYMPRTAGRMLGLLMLEEGPFSFDTLVERLQVSRASVSTNARFLEERGFIERTARPGERQVYLRMADEPFAGLVEAVLRQKRRWLDIARNALEDLPSDEEPARSRLTDMVRFHELVIDALESILTRWRET